MVLAPLLISGGTAVAIPSEVHAAQAPVPGLQITPTKIEQDLKSRTFSFDIRFANGTASIVSPAFEITSLGHDLDGQPLLPAPAPASLRVSSTSARLAPGEASRLTLQGQLPADGAGLYGAVVATVGSRGGSGSGVDVNQRLATLVLLRGPKPWKESVVVETVSARPSAKAANVEVFAQLRNTGNVHVRPTGKVKVIHDGRTLETIDLEPDLVIPTYARRLGGLWRVPAGLEGTVKLETTIDSPGPPVNGTGTVTFRDGKLVVPPGGPGARAGIGADAVPALDEEETESGTGRGLLLVLGALLLLALLVALLLLEKRRRDRLS